MIIRAYNKNIIENKLNIDILISGFNLEERTSHIFKSVSCEEKFIFDYNLLNQKYSLVRCVDFPINKDPFENYKDLTANLINDIDAINFKDKVVLIDSTGFKQPLLFYFLKVIHDYCRPKQLFLGYTEPLEYNFANPIESQDSFALTESFHGLSAIPGFLRKSSPEKNKFLIVFMGFEGNRFARIHDDYNIKDVFAFIGFPPFKTGWHYHSIESNQNILRNTNVLKRLKRITANEPFSAYKELESIKEKYPDSELLIAPIGTKPHSIATCIFAIKHEDVRIVYDYPEGKLYRTRGVETSIIYNIYNLLYDKSSVSTLHIENILKATH